MSNADKQSRMRDWIHQHVRACASTLVHELAQKSEYMDDLMEVCCVQDDWQSPAEYEGYGVVEVTNTTLGWRLNDSGPAYSWMWFRIEDGIDAALADPDVEDRINQHSEEDAWRTACEFNNVDPSQIEAYEHWIVSQWFAERLIEKGEMVTMDFLGLTIWGRTCTGQEIILDHTVEGIYDEMMARRG